MYDNNYKVKNYNSDKLFDLIQCELNISDLRMGVCSSGVVILV